MTQNEPKSDIQPDTDANPYQSPTIPRANRVSSWWQKLTPRRLWYAVAVVYVCVGLTVAGAISVMWWGENQYGMKPNPPALAYALAWFLEFAFLTAPLLGLILSIVILIRGSWWQRLWILAPGYYLLRMAWNHLSWVFGRLLSFM